MGTLKIKPLRNIVFLILYVVSYKLGAGGKQNVTGAVYPDIGGKTRVGGGGVEQVFRSLTSPQLPHICSWNNNNNNTVCFS